MKTPVIRPLAFGYTAEVDALDESQWNELLQEFADSNVYQTWAYGQVIAGRGCTSRLALRYEGKVVALAQARIIKPRLLPIGIAYVRWGPMYRRRSGCAPQVFVQTLRALRNEFACRRGLTIRVFPLLFDDDAACLHGAMEEEGFHRVEPQPDSRTIIMDLRPTLEELRRRMKPHWQRELRVAERNRLETEEGTSDELFGAVIALHDEMVARKKFVEGNDIRQFRQIQALLPEAQKMRIVLARSESTVVAGLICRTIGSTALYLFGATGNKGLRSRGGYLLHSRLLGHLKNRGNEEYDLNGINELANPGTYKFKADLAGDTGRNVAFLGRFDARAGRFGPAVVELAEAVRRSLGQIKALARSAT